ncbi:MAG: hypothetical protein JST40_01100 [Armatimonadetes bacterium]|nr:hypothetical protein [Armatimonadota bacterium]
MLIVFLGVWLSQMTALAQSDRTLPPPSPVTFNNWQQVSANERTIEYQVAFDSGEPSSYPENNTVRIRALLPAERVGPFPTVILLHYWGASDWELEERMSAQLNRRGIATVLVPLPYHLSRTPQGFTSGQLAVQPDPKALRETILQSVSDVRRTMDWIYTRSEFIHEKVGLAGTSLGAIVSTLAFSVEPRIKSGCFILGGVDLAHLLWHSSRVVSQRDILRRNGYTESRLREELADVEPANYLPQAHGKPAMVVRANFDSVVPAQSSEALIQGLDHPTVITLRTGHYGGVLAENQIIANVGAFFQSQFFGEGKNFLAKALKAPTIRLGAMVDGINQLQVAAGIDLWQSKNDSRFFVSAFVTPRGPKLAIGMRISQNLSIGPVLTRKGLTGGLFWNVVL